MMDLRLSTDMIRYMSSMAVMAMPRNNRNIPFLPILRLMAGTIGMKMNAGIVPSHMNTVVIRGVACMLKVMKYESAALLMLMVVKAMKKKNDNTRSGRLRTSSIQRSLTLTCALSLLSITMRSLLSKKVTRSSTSPTNAKMLMVMNQAPPASGVL